MNATCYWRQIHNSTLSLHQVLKEQAARLSILHHQISCQQKWKGNEFVLDFPENQTHIHSFRSYPGQTPLKQSPKLTCEGRNSSAVTNKKENQGCSRLDGLKQVWTSLLCELQNASLPALRPALVSHLSLKPLNEIGILPASVKNDHLNVLDVTRSCMEAVVVNMSCYIFSKNDPEICLGLQEIK